MGKNLYLKTEIISALADETSDIKNAEFIYEVLFKKLHYFINYYVHVCLLFLKKLCAIQDYFLNPRQSYYNVEWESTDDNIKTQGYF